MHSLLRIVNMLNAKHKKIEKSIRNNMASRDRNDEETNKDKSKTLLESSVTVGSGRTLFSQPDPPSWAP